MGKLQCIAAMRFVESKARGGARAKGGKVGQKSQKTFSPAMQKEKDTKSDTNVSMFMRCYCSPKLRAPSVSLTTTPPLPFDAFQWGS